MCTLPTQYAPIIIMQPRKHIAYLTYTICSHYHNTTEVAYCEPYLHNMLQLSQYYRGSILNTLPTQYAPIIILLPYFHTIKVAYCVTLHTQYAPLS